MVTVLVVEDDPAIRTALERALIDGGHTVRSVATGSAALVELAGATPDLVLLDLGLPDLDGLDLLVMLRAISQVPVLVATARDEERDIVKALDRGADDYLVKPFGSEQLHARIRAVLRRVGGPDRANPITVDSLVIDPSGHRVTLRGVELELTRKEFDLLFLLASRLGDVVPRREILAEVWGGAYGADRTADVHLSWLRRKLGETASAPVFLQTVRGVGVRMVDPSSEG